MDEAIFQWLNGWRSPAIDWIMNAVSLSGSALNSVWVIPLLCLLLIRNASPERAHNRNRNNNHNSSPINIHRLGPIGLLVGGFVLAMAVAAALKYGLQLPRPGDVYGSQVIHSFVAEDSRYTFPSGHATFAMWLVVSLWRRVPAAMRALLVVYVLAVGISRINLGMHFPEDVLAGYAVGGLSAWFAARCSLQWFGTRPNTAQGTVHRRPSA